MGTTKVRSKSEDNQKLSNFYHAQTSSSVVQILCSNGTIITACHPNQQTCTSSGMSLATGIPGSKKTVVQTATQFWYRDFIGSSVVLHTVPWQAFPEEHLTKSNDPSCSSEDSNDVDILTIPYNSLKNSTLAS